jgi:hypothetical protein
MLPVWRWVPAHCTPNNCKQTIYAIAPPATLVSAATLVGGSVDTSPKPAFAALIGAGGGPGVEDEELLLRLLHQRRPRLAAPAPAALLIAYRRRARPSRLLSAGYAYAGHGPARLY